MAYSLLKSILTAVKCINILKNNTESSMFTFFLLSHTVPTFTDAGLPKIVKHINPGSAPAMNTLVSPVIVH